MSDKSETNDNPAMSDSELLPPSCSVFGIVDPDYGRVYTISRKLAWEEGYAICIHGSFTRDLDMIAIPWTPSACEPEHLLQRILEAAKLDQQDAEPTIRPHGRLVWILHFRDWGDPRFIDFSIVPPNHKRRDDANEQ